MASCAINRLSARLLEFVFELLAEVLAEPLLSLIARAVASTLPQQWQQRAWLAALGYFLLGLALGGLSVWLFPHHIVRDPVIRGVSWLLSPLACALTLGIVGRARRARGSPITLLDGARYGALFGATVQLVRILVLGP